MPALAPKIRRIIFEQLPRDVLSTLADGFDVTVEDRQSIQSHVDALVRSRKLDIAEVLRELKREELQKICDALELDRGGREKQALVDRILSLGSDDIDDTKDSLVLTSPEPKPAARPSARGPRSSGRGGAEGAADYRHDDTRKNNPPAGLADLDRPPPRPTRTYAYDPHLDPQLVWTGKAERTSFEVDTVSLHIHERISTQAILRAVKREDAQRSLFADIELPESKAIDFYQHDVGWSNRLILGDSLLVMNSLLERERMAGQVQCVYVDPPYGVKFNSNFQPSILRRDVKDGDDGSLTREPEQIRAYRDTWTLGIHSYLTYMRDRLLLARELLHESGSIFVQISDENVHHVRELMDELFGAENRFPTIVFRKTTGAGSPSGYVEAVPQTFDTILWYGKEQSGTKFRRLFLPKNYEDDPNFRWVEFPTGERRTLRGNEEPAEFVSRGARVFRPNPLTSQSGAASTQFPVEFEGQQYTPSKGGWKTNAEGMARLLAAGRLIALGKTLCFVRYSDDFPCVPVIDIWDDTRQSGFGEEKVYIVQTSPKVIARCLLMTTDPGDLVLDPTCGSGTTALVAEQWGRRWVTCDTSRVALALARQRLLTARYPYYALRGSRVRDGFQYRTMAHITLKSIAQNTRLDSCKTREQQERVIRESAEQEALYDQPEEDRSRVRVSGPFTVEAIPVATLDDPGADTGSLQSAARDDDIARSGRGVRDPAGDYLGMMIDLLKKTGVQFKGGRALELPTLRPVTGAWQWLHAESETGTEPELRRVAISFGPRHAPVTPRQVLDAIQETRGYNIVLFVGFACDPEAGRIIDQGAHGRELHFAHAAPDILVGDNGLQLLKASKATKLFTVFGAPDIRVHREKGGMVSVELAAIDLYDPTTGETSASPGENVPAWFVDHDYDGKTFCMCQALFPGRGTKNPWEKLQKALRGTIDEDRFEALRSTRSVPFKPGAKVAVRVIDDRGTEVMKVLAP